MPTQELKFAVQFINSATGGSVRVGHELESCTTEIGIVKCQFPEKTGLDVVFVDTPGFDDTNKSDLEILEMVAEWLKKTWVDSDFLGRQSPVKHLTASSGMKRR